MRILFVQATADKRGHFGIWSVKLCQALARQGHDVTLCTNRVDPSKFLTEPARFRVHEVPGHDMAELEARMREEPGAYWRGYFRNSRAIPRAAIELCKRERFDAMFVTDAEFLTSSLVLRANRRHTPPVVMQVNAANFAYDAYAGSAPKRAYKVLQREAFRRTLGKGIDGLAVLGEWHRDRLRQQLRVPDAFPIEVIPDCGEEPTAVVAREKARERLGLPQDVDILLFFGVLRRDKGVPAFLEAVARAKPGRWRVVLAGSPMDHTEAELKATLTRLGIEDRVLLRVGYVPDEDVPAWFGAADALVLPYPSLYTGGSGPLLKGACTYGLPVIATDVSELGRLARAHALGPVAAADDTAALAGAIDAFVDATPEARRTMAANATALGRANSWDNVAARFAEYLGRVRSRGG